MQCARRGNVWGQILIFLGKTLKEQQPAFLELCLVIKIFRFKKITASSDV